MGGSDGTKVRTVDDGLIWIFGVADHWNTECLGWNVCKVGDRFANFEPISQAVKTIYGCLNFICLLHFIVERAEKRIKIEINIFFIMSWLW